MSQKELGYVELQWTCPNCGTKNPGPLKTCSSCGSPQPINVQFEQTSQQPLITDEVKIAAAKKGADIHCPYCTARNPADATVCAQCGGDLKTGEKRTTGRVVGGYSSQPKPVEQIACPNCATLNPDTVETCSACGAHLQDHTAELSTAASISTPSKARPKYLAIGLAVVAGLFLIALIAYFVMNASRRDNVVASVQDVNW